MDILNQFLTLPILIFSLVIWVLVFLQRTILELKWPSIKENKFWREFLLPLGPIGTGAILGGLISKYPFPETLTELSGRIFCGMVCGLFSGFAYRLLKQFLTSKLDPNAKPEEKGKEEVPLPSDE